MLFSVSEIVFVSRRFLTDSHVKLRKPARDCDFAIDHREYPQTLAAVQQG
jgi:hypothetical protein